MDALRKIWRRLGSDGASFRDDAHAGVQRAFELWYEDLKVGRLEENSDGWLFVYSEDFQGQERVRALADFPKKSKSYRFGELWPFFASRIPSLEQPKVQRQLREENIDSTDTGALLQRYGKRTISNSFVLREG